MILNDNSTQQINTLVIQLQNRITNLNNELKSLNKEASDLNNKISDLESLNKETSDLNNKISDLNTEISDLEGRISSLANDIGAMDTAILANTEAIGGKADKIHTHTKSQITDFPTSLKNPNALTVNGKTYDGSTAVDAGVQTVANGGTGVTTQADINKAFIGNLDVGISDVTDGTEFVSSWASDNGFAETTEGSLNTPYKRQFIKVWNYIKGKADSIYAALSHTHTKSEITDFPASLPANGGTADSANNGFNSSTVTDSTPWWGYLTSDNGYSNGRTYSFANGGGIATAEKDTKSSLQVDGDLYVHEGLDKVVDENSLKDIMKPNYTTGKLPAGVYSSDQTVSVSASITTTRGNPVFISYSGDYNSVNPGSTVPWVWFRLYVDGKLVQTTSVDNSVALESDNTPFAGNALAVLSAGSHTIRLDAELRRGSGQIQFQEQDNLVNLVAFEL